MKGDFTSYKPSKAPTERQAEALRFIAEHTAAKGYPPTLREIGDALRIQSTNGVADHVRGLVRKGLVTSARLVARGIVLTVRGREFLAAVGESPAGTEGGT